MRLFSLKPIEADLRRTVSSLATVKLLHDIDDPQFLRQHRHRSDWHELRQFLEAAHFAAAVSDTILRPVITRYQAANGETWIAVLLYLFWRPVRFIHRKLQYMDRREPMIVFSQIHWSFLAACRRIDLDARGERFSQKILNDTRHDVQLWFQDQQQERDNLVELYDDDGDLIIDPPDRCLNQANAELNIDRFWGAARLRQLLLDGAITRHDYEVLVGCHLDGHSLEAVAAKLGVPYGIAKKRRQRAERKIAKIAPAMSPGSPGSPLFHLGRSSKTEATNGRER